MEVYQNGVRGQAVTSHAVVGSPEEHGHAIIRYPNMTEMIVLENWRIYLVVALVIVRVSIRTEIIYQNK